MKAIIFCISCCILAVCNVASSAMLVDSIGSSAETCVSSEKQKMCNLDPRDECSSAIDPDICQKFLKGEIFPNELYRNNSKNLQGVGDRSPSMSIDWQDSVLKKADGERLRIQALVPADGVADTTYYSALQFNGGIDGGGYCGIQNHPDGRMIIFSIWDLKNKQKLTAEYLAYGAVAEPFGGEGTGLQVKTFGLPWNADTWITFEVRREDSGADTLVSFYVTGEDGDAAEKHIATLRLPSVRVYFNWVDSFLEDWLGNGQQVRSVKYKSPEKYLEGKWEKFNLGVANVNTYDQEHGAINYRYKYGSDCYGDSVHILAGGKSTPDSFDTSLQYSLNQPSYTNSCCVEKQYHA